MDLENKITVISKKYNKKESLRYFFDKILLENKELLNIMQNLNIEGKSHLSTLDENQVNEIKKIISNNIVSTVVTNKIEPKVQKQWKPDLNRMICIKNISNGGLIYKSKRQMGYTIQWDRKGSKNYMELGEFISLKNNFGAAIDNTSIKDLLSKPIYKINLYNFLFIIKK